MSLRKFVGCSAAGAMFASIVPTQASMYPAAHFTTPYVQHVDCAAGLHIGPLGGCILGNDEPRHEGVDHRDDQGGCDTKTIKKEDSMGNSETKTKTNC